MPIGVARNLAALAVIDKLEVYEPRVTLLEVETKADTGSGHIINTYYIGPNEDYEAEDADNGDEEAET